jgi:demethylmenaquinone methyltransferase/2-methoxy-6-polyprenyl-1,4-benzoquinol methylase
VPKAEAIWDQKRLANPHAEADKQKRVRDMFAAIAPSYDLNNRLWSLGIDQSWRRKAVKLSRLGANDQVVDVACGTGDLTILYADALAKLGGGPAAIGVDYTHEMLPPAVRKTKTGAVYVNGDAQRLPLPDASADVVSIAFGIRNVADSTVAYRDFHRVLRPGGRVVVLEFSKPTNGVIRFGYDLYFNHVLTRLASLVARDKTGAYRYLASSVETFKPRGVMQQELEAAGFEKVTQTPLTFGIAVIYVGTKPV